MNRLPLFLLWLLPLFARAQVSVQVLIPPPHSPYLADYQEQYADRNAILLTNTSRQNVTVMLRGELQGRTNGVRVYTSPNYRPARPIELLAGQSQRFTLAESNADYLDRKNLEVAGVDEATRAQILTTGLLPPGAYDLCMLAYRYETGQPVGTPARGCAFLTIAYLEPPRLIQPFCGRDVLIRPAEPNQTLFSWNPPVGNTNGARLAYDFYLVHVPPGQNPNDAINNAIDRRVGNPFIERDLPTTFFNYGVAEPPLTEGQYAWRVVAHDPDRRTVFQNQGRSEYCTFKARNGPALPITDPAKNAVLAQTNPVQKPVILPGPMKVTNLIAPGFSACNDVPAPTDKVPVMGNYQGQTVRIGKFDITIDDITAVGDAYSGKGRVRWNGVPVRVSFTTIQINSAKQVIAGWANGLDETFRMPGVDLGSTDLNDLQNLDGDQLKTYVNNLKTNLFDQSKSALAVPLPLGYDVGSGLIGINYMRFTPTGADMGLIFNMELPEADSYLALAGVGICMAPDKLIPNNALLYLLKDLAIPFAPLTFLKGNFAPANPTGTFAELTAADGLKRVHGELALNLGSDILKLDDGNGNTKPGDVTATLKTDFTKWADWVADVQMPPTFALAPLSGFTLKGVSITYDHSDLRNPAGFAPPAEYTGERGPTFQGIYMAELQVLLPKFFGGQNNNRVGFAAKGCLFAGGEFTGRLTPAQNPLLDYTTGSLGNWGFSIDGFEILFVQNRFERGGMNGKIQFPISTDSFIYTTTLRDNFSNLQFLVKPDDKGYKIPLWAANMNLAPTSHILVGLKDGNPQIDMQLTGNILINTGNVPKAVPLVLPNLYFEQLTVSNMSKPGAAEGGGVYVNPGNWKLVGGIFKDQPTNTPGPGDRKSGGPAAPDVPDEWVAAPGNEGGLAGFPIEIAPPKAVSDNHGFGVELGVYVALGDAAAHIMNAGGAVRLMGKITLDGKRPKPVFSGVYPSRFGVKGNFGAGTVDAAIDIFYGDDSKYGNGFKGVGSVKIPELATVEATVQFGKVSGYYYAYADASVILAPGIPIAPPTPLVLNGLGGGFYYNMTPDGPTPVTTITNRPAPNAPPTPGYTNSGGSYRPSKGGWGIKARVYVALADPHLMTSSLEVESSFNGTALKEFRLVGLANMMDADGSLQTLDDAMEKILRAKFEHDVALKSYNLSVDMAGKFFNYGGIIPIRAYFDPNRYHVMLGDPYGQRMEANIYKYKLGVVNVNLDAKAYVAFGNDLPGMPRLPKTVEDFLGTAEDQTSADAAQTQRQSEFDRVTESGRKFDANVPSGGDFMVLLGGEVVARLEVNVPPLSIKADGDMGFDAALFFNAKCAGNNITAAGLFGWYGEAQIYAYLHGGIDIGVDLFGYAGRYRLCGLSAGAMFSGGLPNPTWAKGNVRATGEVLDGLVSFNASRRVEFGNVCKPQYNGDPLVKVVIISELRPKTDKPVPTDATMAAVFNVNMNREYTVQLPDKLTRTYRFGLGGYSLIYTDLAGKSQPFTGLANPVWADNDQLLLLPINSGQLASKRPHTFTVTATIEEKTANGFAPLLDAARNKRTETKTITFTTDGQPDEILSRNVAYQYPLDGQLYCLKRQVPQGLVAGDLPNEALTKPGASYEAVFVPKEPGPSLRVPFAYQNGNGRYPSRVAFAFAPGLQNEKTYRLELHRITKATFGSDKIALTVNQGRSGTILTNQATTQGTATVRNNRLSGDIQLTGNAITTDKILYSFAFRTSRFNTFAEKVAALRFAPTSYANAANPARADYLTFDLEPASSSENFEDSELFGYRSAKGAQPPLLQPRPLPPISHAYPYEDWVAKNVYDPLFKFNMLGHTDLSFTRFPEMNGGGWVLNFPAAAMQSRRSRVLLTAKMNNSPILSATTPTGGQTGLLTASASITKTLLAASPGNLSMKVNSPVMALQVDFFSLNDEPDHAYKFTVQRDRIGFFDWQAVNLFGTRLYTAREQARVAYNSSWMHALETVSVSASSSTLTLSATYDDIDNMPDALINGYAVSPGTFASGTVFSPRSAGSTGGVLLRYVPYPDGPRQEVQKTFLFTGTGGPAVGPR